MYVVMLCIGFIGAYGLLELVFRVRRKDVKVLTATELLGGVSILIGFFGGVLTQNLYDLIEKGSSYTWTWAMTFYGGLIFGVATFLLGYFLIAKRFTGPCLGDILKLVPAPIAFAHAFGRVGCFMAGCCYGKETDSPLGVVFNAGAGAGVKRLPTNLFEAIFLFVLCGIFLFVELKYEWKYVTPAYLMAYGVWRFIIEFFRDDHRGALIPGLSPSQLWSIVIFVGGAIFAIAIYLRQKKAASRAF
ncbi:MAG: prolipoprotein diacylglyceryl transferase [Bacilli bacterium]|nr:prolipoprotein diacylglyceryl transferase [Bacilli bacterium]